MWSSPIGVITVTGACSTLVASQAPPIPTSTTATSTGASAKIASASPVSVSKNVIGMSPAASTKSRYGAIS